MTDEQRAEVQRKKSETMESRHDIDGLMAGIKWAPSEKQRTQIKKRLEEMPSIYRMNYLKAMRGGSKVAALKAFCLECVGWERVEIERCTDLGCPIYPQRAKSGAVTDA